MSKIRNGSATVIRRNSVPIQAIDAGRRALLVEGVVQSVHPDDAAPGYWAHMLPCLPPKNALILGMGGGTVARLLMRRFGSIAITGVDDSPEMLALTCEFGPPMASWRLIQADAFAFIHNETARYDFIAVDLFHAGQIARGITALPFIKALAARLAAEGTVAFNLFKDSYLKARVAKIERVFERLRLEEIGENAVFHGRQRCLKKSKAEISANKRETYRFLRDKS